MSRAMSKVVLAAAVIGLTSVAALAQQSTTSETKTFEVLAVQGNQLVVSLPEGTTGADRRRRFPLHRQRAAAVRARLEAGHERHGHDHHADHGHAGHRDRGEERHRGVCASGGTIIVRTDEGIKSFTQGDVDKRGVKIMRSGKPAQVSDFRQGDRLSATIITSMPPKVVTEQEVQATLASAATSSPARTGSAAGSGSASSAGSASGQAGAPARTLPKTASPRPLIELATVLALMTGLALMIRRHIVQ